MASHINIENSTNPQEDKMFEALKVLFHLIMDGIKILPAAAVLFWNAFVAAVPTITMLLAFLYLILQITYLIWKWKNEHNEKRTNRMREQRELQVSKMQEKEEK